MMYDFHYPLGQGKLNEDTANCHAVWYGGEGPGSPYLSCPFCPIFLVQKWGLKTGYLYEVHSQSINQELLKIETLLSHQCAVSWATASICFLICASFTFISSAFPRMVRMERKAGTNMRSNRNFREGSGRGLKMIGYEKCFQKEHS